MTSRERVRILLQGRLPDRPPLYDVIRNDTILEHFGEGRLSQESAGFLVPLAHARALDATKSFYRLPHFSSPEIKIDEGGRKITYQRWTTWTEHAVYPSTEAYLHAKTEATAEPWDWNEDDQRRLDACISRWEDLQRQSGDLCRAFNYPGPPRLDGLFSEVGLEAFSYLMADCPDILHRQIEHHFFKVIQAVEKAKLPGEVIFIGEGCDIAFKAGLLFPPSFLKRSFLPGYARFCEAVHRKGLPVQFHSDGNLMEILDDLVDAGMDILHPLEPLAGMNTGEIHRRYPDLILQGSIDVSELLPFGTEQEIADTVKRNIEAADGKIMIGSSTEVNNAVPLRNYLSLHETVMSYRL
jgi:hypothetical protein